MGDASDDVWLLLADQSVTERDGTDPWLEEEELRSSKSQSQQSHKSVKGTGSMDLSQANTPSSHVFA